MAEPRFSPDPVRASGLLLIWERRDGGQGPAAQKNAAKRRRSGGPSRALFEAETLETLLEFRDLAAGIDEALSATGPRRV